MISSLLLFFKNLNFLDEMEANKARFFNSIMPDTVTKDGISYTIPAEWKAVQNIHAI